MPHQRTNSQTIEQFPRQRKQNKIVLIISIIDQTFIRQQAYIRLRGPTCRPQSVRKKKCMGDQNKGAIEIMKFRFDQYQIIYLDPKTLFIVVSNPLVAFVCIGYLMFIVKDFGGSSTYRNANLPTREYLVIVIQYNMQDPLVTKELKSQQVLLQSSRVRSQ